MPAVGVVRSVFYIRQVSPRHLPDLPPCPGRRSALATRRLAGPAAGLWLVLLAAVTAAGPALAACTDPAGPSVVWRRCLMDRRDLAGADLTAANLRDSSLQRAQMAGARLIRVEAPDSRFISADLTDADFTEAVLHNADLTRATLRGARFIRADLRRARLFRADLTGADLTGADLTGTDFSGAILDGVRWTDGQRLCAAGSVGACQ